MDSSTLAILISSIALLLALQPYGTSLQAKPSIPRRTLTQNELQQFTTTATAGEIVMPGANGILIDQGNQAINVGTSDIKFYAGSTVGTECMRIQGSTGNVGIGVTNPTSNFHLASGKTFNLGDMIYTKQQSSIITYNFLNNANSSITGPDANGYYTFSGSGVDCIFAQPIPAGKWFTLRIYSATFLSQTAPVILLYDGNNVPKVVDGPIDSIDYSIEKTLSYRFQAQNNVTGFYFSSRYKSTATSYPYTQFTVAYKGIDVTQDGNSYEAISLVNVGIGKTQTLAPLDVSGNALVSGNVGIGSTQPNASLDVSGNALVSGKIGLGTTNPTSDLHLATGKTTNLGSALSTQMNDTGMTAASAYAEANAGAIGAYNGIYGGTLTGSGPYTITSNTTTGMTGFRASSKLTVGACYSLSITCSGTIPVIQISNNVSGVYGTFTQSTTSATYTINFTAVTNGYLYVFSNAYPSAIGQTIVFSAMTLKRLDTITSGYTGIGTTTPYTMLHQTGSSTGKIVHLISNTNMAVGSGSAVQFGLWPTSGSGTGTNGPAAEIAALCMNQNNGNTDLVFSTYTGVSIAPNYTLQERLRIQANGFVGIGTTSPLSLLHVRGTSINGDVTRQELFRGSRTGTVSVQNSVSMALSLGASTIGISPYGCIDFKANGPPGSGNTWGEVPDVTVMSVVGNGNVGIGNTNPTSTLHLGTGLTSNLGDGLMTTWTDTGTTASSVATLFDWKYQGSYGGTGPYTFTTTVASGAYFTVGPMSTYYTISAGATYRFSITCSSTSAGCTLMVSNSTTVFVPWTSVTSASTTITGTAVMPNNLNGFYVFVNGTNATTVLTFSAIKVERLDTITTGSIGIGTTTPSSNLTVVSGNTGSDAPFSVYQPSMATGSLTTCCIGKSRSSFNEAQIGYVHLADGSQTNYGYLKMNSWGNILCWNGYGRVGIGNNAPSNLLTVGPAVNVSANSAGTTQLLCYGNACLFRNRLIFSNGLTDWNHSIYNNGQNNDNEGAWDGLKYNGYNGHWFRVGNATGASPTTAMHINSSGYVCIGVNSATYPLQVERVGGAISVTSAGSYSVWNGYGANWTGTTGGVSIYATGCVYSVAGFYVWSDERIKTNIQPLPYGLQTICSIQPVSYQYKNQFAHNPSRQVGFVAQQVKEVLPEVVNQTSDFISDACDNFKILTREKGKVTVELHKPLDWKVGDTIKLTIKKDENSDDGKDLSQATVLAITSEWCMIDLGEQINVHGNYVLLHGKKVDDFLAVDYEKLTPVLARAVQELAEQNQSFLRRLERLERLMNV